jgi:hypothetical protein
LDLWLTFLADWSAPGMPNKHNAARRHRDKHGVRGPRTWRKLHLAVDAATGSEGDVSQVASLLDQILSQDKALLAHKPSRCAADVGRSARSWSAASGRIASIQLRKHSSKVHDRLPSQPLR